ncbi:response regulator transcription factor [Paenibacillus hamazuiensis]|uniref:response regulator transcription factor n=1 Tax=Paenibacillus hamazuiensis TaxID=2936508 RepID=UPI00200BC695|nr:response regulator [Paenibacillus hamazuiensis]
MAANSASVLKILIVDDEYFVRVGLQTTIDWHEHHLEVVGEAEDGETGLEMAVRLKPDIILTDMNMPFLDGLGFMEQMRNRGVTAKVIVLSGYDDFQYARGSIAYGVSDYLMKPIENDKLLASVNKVADAIRKERMTESIYKAKLIQDLLVVLKQLRSRKTAGTDKVVKDAIDYIRRNYDKNLSVGEIAEKLYTSPSNLMHAFKKNTSMTVNDYITEYRIEKAKALLSTNRYKIYEVCIRVGMKDPRHFSQLFKRYTNVTPKEYMKSRIYD